jgi:hypothetical protein
MINIITANITAADTSVMYDFLDATIGLDYEGDGIFLTNLDELVGKDKFLK